MINLQGLVLNRLRSSVGVSGETNNGIKKEVLVKDAPRIWIKDEAKLPNFIHSVVSFRL